jgi:hypothetical protein
MTMVWVAAGTVAASSIYSGIQANKAAQAQAGESRMSGFAAIKEAAMDDAFKNMEAEDTMTAARAEADQIRRAAFLTRGTIVVAQSGSGVVIGEGSAQAAMDQLDTLASADALAALYSGVNAAANARAQGRLGVEAGRQRAEAYSRQANSQLAAGRAAMTSGLLGAGAALAGGYAKSGAATKSTASNPMSRYTTGNLGSGD